MTDRAGLARLSDSDLEAALVELGRSLAWPSVAQDEAADPAARARRRIEAGGSVRQHRARWPAVVRRRFGSSLGLAAAAVLIVVAIAGAIGLGLPGIRIVPATLPPASPTPSIPAGPSASPTIGPPTATPGPLGWTLGLGRPVDVNGAAAAVDFPVLVPPATLGAPESAWLLDGRLSLVWPAGPALPALTEPDIGLILTEFQGSLDTGYFEKLVHSGTTVETVRIGDRTGYWISGEPHEIVYIDPSGRQVFDSRRMAGDTLMWTVDDRTIRLESGLGREQAIALAESLK